MSEPTTLAEVQQRDHVYRAGSVFDADVIARKAFVDLFHRGHDADHDVDSSFLFEEDGQRVYRYCMDKNSPDCVYVIMKESVHFGE